MARSIFTITAASETARPDAKGHAEVPLTVTNISGRILRGRAKLVPQDPGQAGWLKVAGNAERDFAANGTQQFTVQIDIPPDVKAGKCSFRLDAVSTELPDEEYTQGPAISVPMAAGAPQKSEIPMWLIPMLAVVLLAVLGGGGFAVYKQIHPSQVAVPAVSGKQLADAQQALKDAGLMAKDPVTYRAAAASVAPLQVIESNPAQSKLVDPGTTVELVVAMPQVPAVARELPDDAVKVLQASGLAVKPPPYQSIPSSDVPAGRVIRTVPDVGISVSPGTTVALVIATAPTANVMVPQVFGRTSADAEKLLADNGLRVGPQPYPRLPRADVAAGLVVETGPPAGRPVPPGTQVMLVLAEPVPPVPVANVMVPQVLGRSTVDAGKMLADNGLKVGPPPYPRLPRADVAAGFVVETDPPAGRPVPPGTQVMLVVAEPVALVPVANVMVPPLLGRSIIDAEKSLTAIGLKVGPPPYPRLPRADVPAGFVVETDPPAGRPVPPGTPVMLVVAEPVPSVMTVVPTFGPNAPLKPVINNLLVMGFDVQLVTTGVGPFQQTVVGTKPSEGSPVPHGQVVVVFTPGAHLPQPIDLKGMNQVAIDAVINGLH
jgi:serine/threonine-protein kinase